VNFNNGGHLLTETVTLPPYNECILDSRMPAQHLLDLFNEYLLTTGTDDEGITAQYADGLV
jgi:hypothetical protein